MSLGVIMFVATIASAPPSATPISLQVDDGGGHLVLRLIGDSPTRLSAHYNLEVTGGASGNSNRSVQSGTARLEPGHSVVVATVRLGEIRGGSWAARLHVTPSVGAAYDLQWRSAP